MNVQWYPGHMTKAKRAMLEDRKLVDLIIEVVDARVPFSSRNPDLQELARDKFHMIVLNKADLADASVNQLWTEYFQNQGIFVAKTDARTKRDMKTIHETVKEACQKKIERDRRRGILNRPIRAMVAGIPNVGKSTFINSFAGRACAKTGNRPGVTRGNQWIRINSSVELLDTPGILWPKFEDPKVGLHLAFIGSIRDEVIQLEELSLELISFFQKQYPGLLEKRYEMEPFQTPLQGLEGIASSRGCRMKGNELDLAKASSLLLDDFRSGRMGRISLEKPECV